MISAVILNWKRPECVEKVVSVLGNNEFIDEIIVCHCRVESTFTAKHSAADVVNLDYSGSVNKNYGLSCRFLAADTARNETVLILDDDVLPNDYAISGLYTHHLENPDVIVGNMGRNPNQSFTYRIRNLDGNCVIVLTRFMMFKRSYASKFFSYSDCLVELQKKARPLWNGEDIFFSLVILKLSGRPNIAYKGLRISRIKNDEPGISSWRGHHQFRSTLIRIAARQLDIASDIRRIISPTSNKE
jgi:hypothetical protein